MRVLGSIRVVIRAQPASGGGPGRISGRRGPAAGRPELESDMVQFTDAERRLIADLRHLIEQHACQLFVEVDIVHGPDGSSHEHHTAIMTGPGIALQFEAELVQAIAGNDGEICSHHLSPVEKWPRGAHRRQAALP